jgi:hypothetical protein
MGSGIKGTFLPAETQNVSIITHEEKGRKEMKRYRRIMIVPVLNGFQVTIGCSTAVFTSAARLARELSRYLRDPDKVEVEYLQSNWNRFEISPFPPGDIASARQPGTAGTGIGNVSGAQAE